MLRRSHEWCDVWFRFGGFFFRLLVCTLHAVGSWSVRHASIIHKKTMMMLRTIARLPTTIRTRQAALHTTSIKMVQIERITPGDGKTFPKPGDTVTMHYTGTLAKNGSEFDSSRKPGRDAFQTQIGVGRVIQGWDQGVPQLSLGERAKLIIPSNEGYGSQGAAGVIPPNADLIFDVELLAINGKRGKYPPTTIHHSQYHTLTFSPPLSPSLPRTTNSLILPFLTSTPVSINFQSSHPLYTHVNFPLPASRFPLPVLSAVSHRIKQSILT